MARPTEFAELLATAVHRIKSCESNKPIRIIQDELGYALGREGESAIYHWRRGNIPKIEDIEKLAREIIRRSDLGKEWLLRFLKSAGHPYPEGICYEMFPATAPIEPQTAQREPPTIQSTALLPRKSYRLLLGRDEQVRKAIASLVDSDGPWAITIDGMGGMGKTALAQEIATTCVKRELFSEIIWISATWGTLPAETQTKTYDNVGALTFETVLNTIGIQLGVSNIVELPLPEKQTRIQALLHRHYTLIVLDNLDVAAESQQLIAERLQPLIGRSRAMLTSRHRFTGDFYAIHLEGLDEDSAQQFIRQEAEYRGVYRVVTATVHELKQVSMLTGGSPLAMKLVVGQLVHLPIGTVLQHLRDVKPLARETSRDEYIHLYQSIYLPSWQLLAEQSKQLLISLALLPPGIGGTIQNIQAVSGWADEEWITRALNELWQLSLVDTGEVAANSLAQISYYLHPLTQHFVVSNICLSGPLTGSSTDFSALFEVNIVRSLQIIKDYIHSNPSMLPSEVHRTWAFHVLTYAFNRPTIWPDTCQLLLTLAPKMEQAGHRADWIPFLEQGILQSIALADLQAEAELRLHLGYLYQLIGKFAEAETQIVGSAKCFALREETRGHARALNRLAYIVRLQRRYEEASQSIATVFQRLQEGDPELADSHFVLGIIAFDKRDWQSAAFHFQRSLQLWEKLGDKRRIAWGLRNLGPTLRAQGQYSKSIECYTKAINLLEEVHDSAQQAVTRMNLGVVYLTLEQPQQALDLFMLVEPILDKVCDALHLAMNHCNMGIAYRALQQWQAAETAFLSSLAQWQQIGNTEAVVNVLDELGLVYLAQGLPKKAEAIFQDALDRLVLIKDEPGYQYQLEVVQAHLKAARQTST